MEQPNVSLNSEADEEKESFRNWLDLPTEVTATILHKIGAYDILNNAQYVCTSWLKICKDPSMWKSIDFHLSSTDEDYHTPDAEDLAYLAVHRSCGQLVEISMELFATDEFIHYLAEQASQLLRLRIISCHYLSEDILKETAAKFPHLEELQVQSTQFSTAAMEAVGRSCPQLRSLKIINLAYRPFKKPQDDKAAVIAETMPQLCHLHLIGNRITNDGLKLIVNRCLSLESLDLRRSHFVDLEGDDGLGKICASRIKIVRNPFEPIGENEFRGMEDSYYSDNSFVGDYFGHIAEVMSDFDDGDYFDHIAEVMSDFDDGDLFLEDGNIFGNEFYYELDDDWWP